jgi:16S rRNA (cytosine967-C5)-methyltransferase
MSRVAATSPRSLALHVLQQARAGYAFVNKLLDESLGRAGLNPPDARLATHLVNGVLRRRDSLDALIGPFIQRPLRDVEGWLMDSLRLGAYQLAILSNIPPHAALNETVELATDVDRPDAKGFLNGVLRRVAEVVTEERTAAPAADALPLEEGVYRKLSRPLLPDPATRPLDYIAAGFSWPRWLADRWLSRFGWDECVRLGFWFAAPAPLWLRVNALRTDRGSMLKRLSEAGVAAEPGGQPQSVRLLDSASIRDLPGYFEGHFAVQDETAMRVAAAVAPQPGQKVLDLCAAPGGKTTHLAELMRDQGRILACDVDAERLATVGELARRLGHTIIETRRIAADPPPGPFDAILADVPCSNTGVLGRRPEARWRLQPADFQNFVPLQTRLLLQAARRVRPGGTIVYSTCSIEPEENTQVVKAVLREARELSLEGESSAVPGRPADGGYWARLRRRGVGLAARGVATAQGRKRPNRRSI